MASTTCSTHTLTTSPVSATEAGALSGHAVKCSCGYHATTSLSDREALKLGWAHKQWAEKAGR